MRTLSLATLVFLTTLVASPAFACRLAQSSPPPPSLSWPSRPDFVEPGETVVEIEFVRGVFEQGIDDPDILLIGGCGPAINLFRVVKSISGPSIPDGMLVIANTFAIEQPGTTMVVVGRLKHQAALPSEAKFRADIEPSILQLVPRLPPG